jgi:hypothetical protein
MKLEQLINLSDLLNDFLKKYSIDDKLAIRFLHRKLKKEINKTKGSYFPCKICNETGIVIVGGKTVKQAMHEAALSGEWRMPDLRDCNGEEKVCRYCKGDGYFSREPKEVWETKLTGYEVENEG